MDQSVKHLPSDQVMISGAGSPFLPLPLPLPTAHALSLPLSPALCLFLK